MRCFALVFRLLRSGLNGRLSAYEWTNEELNRTVPLALAPLASTTEVLIFRHWALRIGVQISSVLKTSPWLVLDQTLALSPPKTHR